MENLNEAKEDVDEVDPNIPDLLLCNDQGQVYGYPESEDDEEETFVDIPKGVVQVGEGDMEWKWHKCLHELNQFPNQTIEFVLKKLGFVKSATEHGIYAREEGEEWINNALYFDDELLMWRKERSLMGVKESLSDGIQILGVGKTPTEMYSG